METLKKLVQSKLFLHSVAMMIFATAFYIVSQPVYAAPLCADIQVGNLGFEIPSFSDILTFLIRGFFTVAGLAALLFLLLGAFAWITSGGDKDAISAAQKKIQAAVIGLIMIIVVLAIIWTIENIIFARKICVGLTCPVTIPGLLEPTAPGTGPVMNCVCPDGTTINFAAGQTCAP